LVKGKKWNWGTRRNHRESCRTLSYASCFTRLSRILPTFPPCIIAPLWQVNISVSYNCCFIFKSLKLFLQQQCYLLFTVSAKLSHNCNELNSVVTFNLSLPCSLCPPPPPHETPPAIELSGNYVTATLFPT
jgi:hypothetical protein